MHLTRVATTLTLVTLLAAPAMAATKTERIDRLFSVPAGTAVSVSNVNGPITVTSWDRPQIRLVAEKKVKTGSEASAAQALRELKIEIEHRRGTLDIRTRHPKSNNGFLDWLSGNSVDASVRYELTVPRNLDASLETVNGTVKVQGVQGRLEIETVNGRIAITSSGGAIEASTVNGGIDAELLNVVPAEMSLSTVNGGVELSLPATVQADLNVRTVNGGISSDLPLTAMTSGKRQLRGQINGGGPALEIRTTNGGVRIRQSN